MNFLTSLWKVTATMMALLFPVYSFSAGFIDRLDTPALYSALASKNLLLSVTNAGGRIVAVGVRGHILFSDDEGVTWEQAFVPVSTDLTSVFFANDRDGWAVGHDGVILNSRDGGSSWAKQLDGRQANELMVAGLERKVDQDESGRIKKLLLEAQRNRETGPDNPFLDVWFSDAKNGFAVGAYNLIFHTTDGGEHWESWFDRTENPYLAHFYSIQGQEGSVNLVGELGVFLHLDPNSDRFVARTPPYDGSFFGLLGDENVLVALGMRGKAFRTLDQGLIWEEIDTGVQAGLSGGVLMSDGRMYIVSQAGDVLLSSDNGMTFSPLPLVTPAPFTGISVVDNKRLILVGTRGIQIESIP